MALRWGDSVRTQDFPYFDFQSALPN